MQLFFVLSGFLLYRQMDRYFERSKLPSYFIRRVARIIPAYYAAFAFAFLLNPYLPSDTFQLSTHLLIIHTYFPSTFWAINGAFWSLGPELQFYLLLPLIVYFFRSKLISSNARISVLVLSFILLLGLRLISTIFIVPEIPEFKPVLTLNFIGIGDSFIIGMLIAEIHRRSPQVLQISRTSGLRLLEIVLVISFILIAEWDFTGSVTSLRKVHGPIHESLMQTFISLEYGLLLFLALDARSLIAKICSTRLFIAIGTVSYGIFLFHLPLLESSYFNSILQAVYLNPTNIFVRLPSLLVLSSVLGTVSWFLIERPAIRWAHRPSAKEVGEAVNVPA